MVLDTGTHSRSVVLGGILTIAVADAFSDALGMHISEESEGGHSQKEIWLSTVVTLFSKFIFASLFLVPVMFLDLKLAVMVSVLLGILLIGILSYHIARLQKIRPWEVILEHLVIMLFVVIISLYIGKFVEHFFGST